MARAYLQGQGQEREPEPVLERPDGSHRYWYPQKQGHRCHHRHHFSLGGDVHGPPSSGLPGGSSSKEGGGWSSGGGRWSSKERGGGG